MQTQTTQVNFAKATKKELAAAGFTVTNLKMKKATRGTTHYTKHDCKRRNRTAK
jgi:hypothetical protein